MKTIPRCLAMVYLLAASLLAACSADTQPRPQGSLAIAIEGLPAGVSANVTVSGPDGYSLTVHASRTIHDLTPGEYAIAAAEVDAGDNRYVPDPQSQSVTVTANAAASATVRYSLHLSPETAQLEVNISGLPGDDLADVTVTGPNDYSQELTSSTTLEGLAPGDYTVTALSIVIEGTTYAPSPASQSVSLTAGEAKSVGVAYSSLAGSLQVNVSGLPGDVAADITVTGPEGYRQSVTETTTLDGLAPGPYAIAASNVPSGDTTYVPEPETQTITVSSSATATAGVTYALQQADTGDLSVSITGLPAGLDADVTVAGPKGYSQRVTTSVILTGLTPGNYVVSAQAVGGNGSTYRPEPSSQEVTVTPNATATATVTYELQDPGPECVDPVEIPDYWLRGLVLAALGKSEWVWEEGSGWRYTNEDAEVSCGEMARLTELSDSGPEVWEGDVWVETLEGLQHAKNLTSLALEGSRVADLSPLQDLQGLTRLHLTASMVSDLSPLAGLRSLTYLDLGCSWLILDWCVGERIISDISPLAALTNLTHLRLSQQQISDLSALGNLINLTSLTLYTNQISDLSALGNLANLTSLHLYDNQISDITPLGNLTSLTHLSFGADDPDGAPLGNHVSDIAPLENLTNLHNLNLFKNDVFDISPLVRNSGLGSDSSVNVTCNLLDLADEATMADLDSLRKRGVALRDEPQKPDSSCF